MPGLKHRTNSGLVKTVNNNSFYCKVRDENSYILSGSFEYVNFDGSSSISKIDSNGNVFSNGTTLGGFIFSVQSIGNKTYMGGVNLIVRNLNQTIPNHRHFAVLDENLVYDTSFGTVNSWVYDLEPVSNNRMMICGRFASYIKNSTSYPVLRLAVLDTNGDIDPTFDTSNGANNVVASAKQDANGKIIIGGQFTSYAGNTCNRIARLNTDGSFDSSFNIGTGFDNYVSSITIQDDGKIIVVGGFTSYNGVSLNRIVRLNTDGSLDTGFNIGSGFDSDCDKVHFYNNKIYAVGSFTSYNGNAIDQFISLNLDGSINTGFNANGAFKKSLQFAGVATQLKTLSNYLILGDPYFTQYKNENITYLLFLDENGNTNNPLPFSNGVLASSFFGITELSNGSYVLVGAFPYKQKTASSRCFIAINPVTGDVVKTHNEYLDSSGYGALKQTSNKYVFFGILDYINSSNKCGIIRMNQDWTLDNTFNPNGVGTHFNGRIYSAVLNDSDGILCTGSFTSYNGVTKNRIVMLTSEGLIDNSFNVGTGLNNQGYSLLRQPDGKFVVSGGFSSYNGVSVNDLVRLNTDGTRDSTFNSGSGSVYTINHIFLQPDGKIVCYVGLASTYNGSAFNYFFRVNPDGSFDTTFQIPSGLSGVGSLVLLQNGQFLAFPRNSLTFTYNGNMIGNFLRLNEDGSIDSSLSNTYFDNTITGGPRDNTAYRLLDGSVLVSVNNIFNTSSLIKINPNGVIDNRLDLSFASYIQIYGLGEL